MADHLRTTTVKAARRKRRCYFCATAIEVGETYLRCVWADNGTVGETVLHPECATAWHDADIDETLTPTGDYNRGCPCMKDPACPKCYQRRETPHDT